MTEDGTFQESFRADFIYEGNVDYCGFGMVNADRYKGIYLYVRNAQGI
jgi:hypothetical protein